MTTPTIELMSQHGSVRHYKPDPVPESMIEGIVAAGQRASTSSNLQTYSVVATTDSAKKEQLMEISGGQRHIIQAPVFLLWCADFSRLKRVCLHQGYELNADYLENFLIAAVDAAIASQNAGLAAESLGLGFCYLGAIRNQPRRVISLFDLPELVFPVFGMTLGWPVKAPLIRPRLPLKAVLHWDTYQQDDLPLLEEYDQAMIETGIYRGRQVDQPDQDPAIYGWMEHSARRVSKPSRPQLREAVMEAGFSLR
ncbi:MAG TPA: NADPH-dependent oxidoreductase [Chloroflexi bacterium]|nr:MAG: NADPH-dependent oxidoreductase [Chloroflexota bacterium]HDD55425.1 NADPH-dependent oxidoreductase [Chloroflexota bacterium]